MYVLIVCIREIIAASGYHSREKSHSVGLSKGRRKALLLSGPALGILISLENDYTRLDTKMKKVGLIKRKQTESEYLLQYYEASCVIY